MRREKLFGICLAGAVLLFLAGCASTPPSGKNSLEVQTSVSAPRSYRPLEVRNSCFVESIHFCDFYEARQLGGTGGWARILQWGDRQKDYSIKGGHAVAVYQLKNRLWVYDVNNGFLSLAAPVERKLDLTEVSPQIVKRYPDMKPALMRYVEPLRQSPEKKGPDYTKGATTQDLDETLKVAVELGRFRPVRVVEFIAPGDSYLRPYAATVFQYGDKLCLYSPQSGTRGILAPLGGADDLNVVQALVRSVYPDAQSIKWFQPAQAVVIR